MSHIHCFSKKDGVELTARVYPRASDKPTILYFHGGGLLYGDKDDLPEEYIKKFMSAGYSFITFDYRLAPEVALSDIYTDIQDAVQWFFKHYKGIGLSHNRFLYFGRSAGAYLTFLAAKDASLPRPEKMISFYGYSRLDIKEFHSKSYQHVASIPKILVDRIIETKPLVSGPIEKRFALYIYARQTGSWIKELLHNQEIADYQLELSDLQALPPVFIAQSRRDQDVPFYVGEMLHEHIPKNQFFIVENGEHDFDRNPDDKSSKEAYQNAIAFCEKE
ncbi:alpha/beta hydrolase [Bacillus sp. JJ722]|uniref:alpha/beta hydrolase n=1 Tax=Bacillus sp. JJ722 TaxID=3122973 RepID=UPI002FFF7207